MSGWLDWLFVCLFVCLSVGLFCLYNFLTIHLRIVCLCVFGFVLFLLSIYLYLPIYLGYPRLSSTGTLSVLVEDLNDNPPTFHQNQVQYISYFSISYSLGKTQVVKPLNH